MDGNYPQGSGAPPHMMGYFPGYNIPQGGVQSSGSASNPRTGNSVSIWAGDLDAYMDETFLRQAVTASGWGQDITRIKVVRDHYSGIHAGYGFLDASSPEAAERVIQTGSGMPIPGTNRCWRLNMGRNAAAASSVASHGTESNVYIGNLEASVTDYELMTAFRPRYSSVRHAKVVCNEFGQSKGYGFVRFGNPIDAERAVAEMQGFLFHQKPVRLSPAAGRMRNNGASSSGSSGTSHGQSHGHGSNRTLGHFSHQGAPMHGLATHKRPRQLMSPDDPNNTTLFIGGTAAHISEELLWREFITFGDLEAVRVPHNKTGFVFVRFRTRESALRAKEEVSRTHFVSLNPVKPVRVEWASEQIPVARPSSGAALAAHEPHLSLDRSYPSYPDSADVPERNVPASNPTMNSNENGNLGVGFPNAQVEASGSDAKTDMEEPHISDKSKTHGPDVMGMGKRDMFNGSSDCAGAGNGEIEPPSKRVAVARPEYAGSSARTVESSETKVNRNGASNENCGEESPAMQFSWLNASAQASSNSHRD